MKVTPYTVVMTYTTHSQQGHLVQRASVPFASRPSALFSRRELWPTCCLLQCPPSLHLGPSPQRMCTRQTAYP